MLVKALLCRVKIINVGENMKNKILAIFICVLLLLSVSVPVAFAGEEAPDLTLNFNERYTDISEYEDINDPYLDLGQNKEDKEQKRDIYVVVLVVLLVISIIVFVRTLRRVPEGVEEEPVAKKVRIPKSSIEKKPESTSAPNLADEEKTE